MKIVVTGASGFVGRHVLVELARRALPVIAARRDAAALLSPDTASAGVRWVAVDHHRDDAASLFDRLGQPDVLIHLAWAGLPNYKTLHHFESELPAQYRFISGLVRAGLRRVICTGTCFEYGMQSGALSVDMRVAPTTPYGFAKDTLRRQLEFLRSQLPFELVWARLFYMYGDGQAPISLYSSLRAAVARGDAVFPMSGGEQIRDFLPIGEVARRLVDLALDVRSPQLVNVCSGQPTPVRALVERWIAENGWNIHLHLGCYPYPDYEPMEFWGVPL